MLITKLWSNDIQFSLKFALQPWEDLNLGGLCSSCFKAAHVAYCRARTTNWDQLKTYFGLRNLEYGLDWDTSNNSDSSESEASTELVDDDAGLCMDFKLSIGRCFHWSLLSFFCPISMQFNNAILNPRKRSQIYKNCRLERDETFHPCS